MRSLFITTWFIKIPVCSLFFASNVFAGAAGKGESPSLAENQVSARIPSSSAFRFWSPETCELNGVIYEDGDNGFFMCDRLNKAKIREKANRAQ